jgi:hypothetical protein
VVGVDNVAAGRVAARTLSMRYRKPAILRADCDDPSIHNGEEGFVSELKKLIPRFRSGEGHPTSTISSICAVRST